MLATNQDSLIGAPIENMGNIGHIVAIAEARPGSMTAYALGGNGLEKVRTEYVYVMNGHKATISDVIARPMLERARQMNAPRCEDPQALLAEAEANAALSRERARDREAERRALELAFKEECAAKIPAWAKAVIVAELHKDDCDSMSDYFNYKTTKRVIIGFSKHDRNLFPELREAARHFSETAELADAPASAEHRENWSMGAGYYLKSESKYRDGWAVKKRVIGRDGLPTCGVAEFSLPSKATAPVAVTSSAEMAGRFTIEEHTHTKKGFQMHICILGERVDRAAFDDLRAKAESMGGWYSRPWGKTPGGFAFKDRGTAEAFAGLSSGNQEIAAPAPAPAQGAQPAKATGERMAEKLEALADSMQPSIDDAFRDRLSNTPKRARQAAEARLDGEQWRRAQKGARALAAAHRVGNVPAELATVATKSKLFELAASRIDRSGGYYDAGRCTGKPYSDKPDALAFWSLVGNKTPEQIKADAIREAETKLKFSNIEGYFPTPGPIVQMMLDRADVQESHRVLEPSAGSGSIMDAVRTACPGAALTGFETQFSLVKLLCLKGHEVQQADFMQQPAEAIFDRVLMNPPFERGQDIDHVRHAFDFLKPGGRLVAIMSPGAFFRSDKKATEFRAWFDSLGGDRQDIEAGAFKESGTGIATVLVELRKEG